MSETKTDWIRDDIDKCEDLFDLCSLHEREIRGAATLEAELKAARLRAERVHIAISEQMELHGKFSVVAGSTHYRLCREYGHNPGLALTRTEGVHAMHVKILKDDPAPAPPTIAIAPDLAVYDSEVA